MMSWNIKTYIRRLFAEQPIDKIFRFDAVIGSIEARFKGQHDFFVVVADALQRCKLPLAYILAHHGFGDLDIFFLIGGRCDESNLRVADLADRYIVSTAEQLKIHDIFDGVTAVPIAETQQIIA